MIFNNNFLGTIFELTKLGTTSFIWVISLFMVVSVVVTGEINWRKIYGPSNQEIDQLIEKLDVPYKKALPKVQEICNSFLSVWKYVK